MCGWNPARGLARVNSIFDQRPLAPADLGDRDRARRLGDQLRAALHGRNLAVGWIHGDLWPGNVLVRRAMIVPDLREALLEALSECIREIHRFPYEGAAESETAH